VPGNIELKVVEQEGVFALLNNDATVGVLERTVGMALASNHVRINSYAGKLLHEDSFVIELTYSLSSGSSTSGGSSGGSSNGSSGLEDNDGLIRLFGIEQNGVWSITSNTKSYSTDCFDAEKITKRVKREGEKYVAVAD
jgi:hypothetical protein